MLFTLEMHILQKFFLLFTSSRFVKTVESMRPPPSPRCRKPHYFYWGFLHAVADCLSLSVHLLFLLKPDALFLAPNSEALSQLIYSDPAMEAKAISMVGSKEEVQSISDWFSDFHDMRQGTYTDTTESSD